MNDRHLNYESYSAEDFAADPYFIQWVKKPDVQHDQFWKTWLNHHPHKQAEIEEACALVRSIEFSFHPDTQEAVQDIWEKIHATNRQHQEAMPVQVKTIPKRFTALKIAASLTVTLLIASALFYIYLDNPVLYHTNFGETRQISLPDGSVVTLNANSILKLGDWKEKREVWLQGEAFFSVRKKTIPSDPLNPIKFTVHTSTLDVNVLGTEFTVSDRAKTVVVLNEGKIELTMPDKSILMKPGDMVEISAPQKQLVQRTVDPKVYSAWKDHEWILDGLSLAQIAGRIEETFGLEVVIKSDPEPDVEVTGVVPTDNLETLLNALSAAFDRQFKRQGRKVFIE